jgi:hypothetical protein
MNAPSGTRRTVRRATFVSTAAALVGGLFAALPGTASAADAPTTLIDTASTTWKYLEDNTDPAGTNADTKIWTKAGFDDTAWKSAKGSFGAKGGKATGIGSYTANTLLKQYVAGSTTIDTPTFFFRTTINLTQAQIDGSKGLTGSVVHDDALQVFVNGTKTAGVDDAKVTQNLGYAGVAAGEPKTSPISVDKSLLKPGANTVAVALYQDRPESSDIFLDFQKLETATGASVSDLNLTIGADETQRNVAWYSTSGQAEVVQVAKKSDVTGTDFPAAKATSIPAVSGETTAGGGQRSQKATISGLQENTAYVYRVGSAAAWSKAYDLKTQAFSGDYNFLLFGDPQIGASGDVANDQLGWQKTLDSATTKFPKSEFLFSAGDQVEHAANETEYDAFLAPDQLRSLPLSPINGNHDVGSKAYEQHYNVPNFDSKSGAATSATSSGGDHWYIFKDVLYIILNSNSQDTASHKAFVEKVVAEQGDKVKWKIVGFHHSIYSVAAHANDTDIIARRAALPTILSDVDIDLVLMGHDHVYTRSYLINDGLVAEDTKQAVQGTVKPKEGDVLYVTANSASGSKYYDIRNQKYDFAAVTNQEYLRNYSNVEVTDKALTVTTYRSDAGTEVDKVTLEKKPDITKPELKVPATGSVKVGETFNALAGVTATDDEDGDVTGAITVQGTVDTTKKGTATLTYTVIDKAGNTTTATRTVTVTDGTLTAATPTVSGTARVGSTLTAAPGVWTPGTALAYAWAVDGVPAAGATGSTFDLTPSLAGRAITVTVTGTKADYTTAQRTSAAVTVANGTLASAKPRITGSAKVGKTLKVKVGRWSPTPSFRYTWYAGGKVVKTTSSPNLTVSKKWAGKKLKVKVTGSLTGYTTKSATSSWTSKVKDKKKK